MNNQDHNNSTCEQQEIAQIESMMRSARKPTAPSLSDGDMKRIVCTAQSRKRSSYQKRAGACVAALVIGFVALSYNEPIQQATMKNTADNIQCGARLDSYFDPFAAAMSDEEFADLISAADLGYGYEVVEIIEEEDGSFTFVLYFYTDSDSVSNLNALRTAESDPQNLRSFHWKISD